MSLVKKIVKIAGYVTGFTVGGIVAFELRDKIVDIIDRAMKKINEAVPELGDFLVPAIAGSAGLALTLAGATLLSRPAAELKERLRR